MKTGWIALAGALVAALGACGGSTALLVTPDGGAGAGGSGGAPGYDSCRVSADCLVRPASCCGSCGAATRSDAIGINKQRADAYNQDKCSGVACPACYREQDPTLVAACTNQSCRVLDVQNDAATACTSDSDCRIRTTSCCECGGAIDRAHIIAISNEVRFSSLVCEGVQGCPECAPVYPAEVSAHCGATHHCTAVWQAP